MYKSSQTDLINALSKNCGISKAKADQIIRETAAEVARQMAAGNDVRLFGIGKLYIKHRDAGIARIINGPKAGTRVPVPARKVVSFRPHSALVAKVRGE